MTRISIAQARKMGIKIPGASTPKTKGSSETGRNRAGVISYEGDPIEFTVPLAHDPKPKERPRTAVDHNALKSAFLASRGKLSVFMDMVSKQISRTYTPKATLDYEKVIKGAAEVAMLKRKVLECPLETSITLVLQGDPKTWPTSRLDGDADNLEKAVLDALNGIVFKDDSLVVRSSREKICGETPMVIVRVSPARPDTYALISESQLEKTIS